MAAATGTVVSSIWIHKKFTKKHQLAALVIGCGILSIDFKTEVPYFLGGALVVGDAAKATLFCARTFFKGTRLLSNIGIAATNLVEYPGSVSIDRKKPSEVLAESIEAIEMERQMVRWILERKIEDLTFAINRRLPPPVVPEPPGNWRERLAETGSRLGLLPPRAAPARAGVRNNDIAVLQSLRAVQTQLGELRQERTANEDARQERELARCRAENSALRQRIAAFTATGSEGGPQAHATGGDDGEASGTDRAENSLFQQWLARVKAGAEASGPDSVSGEEGEAGGPDRTTGQDGEAGGNEASGDGKKE